MKRLRKFQPDVFVGQIHRERDFRRGTLLLEMIVCTVILSTVAAILAPAIHGVKRQRIATRFEAMAMIEMTNIAEKLRASPEESAKPELSKWFAHRYTGATLEVQKLPTENDDVLQPVKITVARKAYAGDVEIRRSLVTWTAKAANE